MVNKALRIVLYSIFTISLLFVMPVNIYADTIDSHIRGRNYSYEPITYNEIQLSTNTYYQNIGIFHITFELDDEYIGYVLPNYSIQYDNYFYGAQTPNWGTLSSTFDRRVFVNGSSFSFDIPINWNSININSAPGGDPFNYDSYTITSSDVIKYADIDSLDQIINILQENQDIVADIYAELQTIVSNTSLANDYLETISLYRQWNFPFESFSLISNIFNYVSKDNIVDYYYDNNYYIFPEIKLTSNYGNIGRFYLTAGKTYKLIMLVTNVGNINQFNNNFAFSSSLVNINAVTSPNTTRYLVGGIYPARFIVVEISASSSTNSYLSYIGSSDTYIVPIYFNDSDFKYVSTDFALLYGLSNQLLDDIQIIANGTNESSAASSQSDQANSQLQQDSNTLFTQEDSFKQNMNSAMQNIDTTFSLNNFGSSFMTSAQWVRTQYETLTNNTPFASLITFSLLVGLALIVIGKVYK